MYEILKNELLVFVMTVTFLSMYTVKVLIRYGTLKACLLASPSNHLISKIIEKIFFGMVRKTPDYDDDEFFLWYGCPMKGV